MIKGLKNILSKKPLHYRFESFGGIISVEDPPLLVFVDQDYMRKLGLGESPLWRKKSPYLSAPVEVHFSVTNGCPVNCEHCYMDSGAPEQDELDLAGCKKMLKDLSEMGVFHAALGGGEAFSRSDFLEIAEYAREVGIVPNLTTNGYYIDDETARKCKVFGQVNVSINSLKESGFSMADAAVSRLKKAGVPVGINCIISRKNYAELAEIYDYARSRKMHDIEFLRFKPAGRGKQQYYQMKLSKEQNKDVYPYLMRLSKKYKIATKIDCSFVPMMCYHRPDKEEMRRLAVYGCEAGNVLLSIFSNGEYAGCSFAAREKGKCTGKLKSVWRNSAQLKRFRNWLKHAPAPCAECDYLDICKGGCHMVAEFETGDFYAPDPDCPFI